MKTAFTKIKLKDVCEQIFSGGTPDTRKSEYWNGTFKWLSSGETRNRFIKTSEKKITQEGIDNSSTKLAKKGDVLVASAGQGQTRGQTSFCLSNTYINQSIISFRTDKQKLNPLFLFYFLTNKYQELRDISDANSIRGSLTCKIFENLDIKIPEDINYQARASTLLYNYDLLIEKNNCRIQLLEQIAKLIYDEWFVKLKFPGHEHLKMIDSELGKIPEGWEIKKIEDFGEIITGKTPPTKEPVNYGDYMYFIKTPDMHNNIFCIRTEQKLSEKGVDTQKNKTLPPNSLIVSCIGTIGVVSITTYQSQTNQQINALKLRDLSYLEYLYFTFKGLKEHLKNLGSTGATMGNVNKEKFQLIKILSPSNAVMYNFSQVISNMFEEIKNLQIKNQNLSLTRDLLLPKLISGEIDVSRFNIKIPMEDT